MLDAPRTNMRAKLRSQHMCHTRVRLETRTKFRVVSVLQQVASRAGVYKTHEQCTRTLKGRNNRRSQEDRALRSLRHQKRSAIQRNQAQQGPFPKLLRCTNHCGSIRGPISGRTTAITEDGQCGCHVNTRHAVLRWMAWLCVPHCLSWKR